MQWSPQLQLFGCRGKLPEEKCFSWRRELRDLLTCEVFLLKKCLAKNLPSQGQGLRKAQQVGPTDHNPGPIPASRYSARRLAGRQSLLRSGNLSRDGQRPSDFAAKRKQTAVDQLEVIRAWPVNGFHSLGEPPVESLGVPHNRSC